MAFRMMAYCAVALSLAACSAARGPGRESTSSLDPGQIAKSDIDRVCETHRRDLNNGLRQIAEKLYRRNPREWRKTSQSADEAMARLFDPRFAWRFDELDGRFGTDAIQLAFREEYQGDRVFALIAGLGGMLYAAFDGKSEFYMLDTLDAQKLNNAARNIEIAVWRLSNNRAPDGTLFLLSNDPGPPANLSFEREFGKMIGGLDTLSRIIADKTNRTVVMVIQNMATALFLPVSLHK